MFPDGALRFSSCMSLSFSMSSFPLTTPCSSCHGRIVLIPKEIKLRRFCGIKFEGCLGSGIEAYHVRSQSRISSARSRLKPEMHAHGPDSPIKSSAVHVSYTASIPRRISARGIILQVSRSHVPQQRATLGKVESTKEHPGKLQFRERKQTSRGKVGFDYNERHPSRPRPLLVHVDQD